MAAVKAMLPVKINPKQLLGGCHRQMIALLPGILFNSRRKNRFSIG